MEFAQRFDRIALRALQNTAAPSLSIAATYDGKIAYCKAFGAASPASTYSIASITKQFTAACVLLLARERRLSLEDPVSKWFPDITASDRIRLSHLLSHTSGLADFYPLGFADEEKMHDTSPEAIVRTYAGKRLQFDPGTAWSYSNTGYHLAGLIIERVTGEPFGERLTEQVLRPSGMGDSFFNDPPHEELAEHVRGHTRYCLGPLRRIAGERAGWTYASGGLASSARDLAQWQTVLMNGDILTPGEVALMTTPVMLADGSTSPTALGWFSERRGNYNTIQHSGGVAGFSSQAIVSLEQGRSIIVLANGDHVQTGAIASELFQELLPGANPPAPNAPESTHHIRTAARTWIEQLMCDAPADRSTLTPQFHAYLDDQHRADARAGLRDAGDLQSLTPVAAGERGGMSWFRVRADLSQRSADVLFRETADGRLAEFMAYPVP